MDLAVTLTDISGKQVAQLLPPTRLQGGIHDLDFRIPASISAGNYQLQMTGPDFRTSYSLSVSRQLVFDSDPGVDNRFHAGICFFYKTAPPFDKFPLSPWPGRLTG
jgi:hypothetical protein